MTAINLLQSSMAHTITEALGWTLVHFLWQGTLVAIVLWCALALMARRAVETRYGAACVALLAMVALPVVTFVRLAEKAYSLGMLDSSALDGGTTVLRVGADTTASAWWPVLSARLDQIMPWLMLAWCAGVLVFSCRLSMGMAAARRLRIRETESVCERLQGTFDALCSRLGIRRAVALVHSTRVHVPTVIGWLKPVVLLPAACLSGLSDLQIEALLAHELAHIRRNDYLVSVLQSVVETVLFYHPAVWWVSKQVRRERECCCDELAVRVCGDRVAYARALSLLEEQRALLPEVVLGANGGVLTMRIKRLLGYREEIVSTNVAWAIVLAVVIAGTGSIVGRFAYAESKQAPAAETKTAEQAEMSAQAAALATDAARQAAEINEQVRAVNQQSASAQEQLNEMQRALAGQTKDTVHWTAADQKHLDEAMQKMQVALQQLNSEDFKKQMEQLQRRLNSPEFHKQIEDATAAAMKVSSAEMQKQMEKARKQLEDAHVLQEQMRAKFNSPEFKRQIEQARVQAEAAAAKVNSPEFRAQIEAMRKKAAEFDTPEFREKMKKLSEQSQTDAAAAREKANQMLAARGIEPSPNPAPATGPETQPKAAPTPDGPVRVSAGVASGMTISRVDPVYPQAAKDAHVQGTVVLKAIIGKTGDVEKLSVVSGPPELAASAIDAVRQWKYKPYLLNGMPVEVLTTINVNYTLGGDDATPSPVPQSNIAPVPSTPAVPAIPSIAAVPPIPNQPAAPATRNRQAVPSTPSVPPVPPSHAAAPVASPSDVRFPSVIYKVNPKYTPQAKAAKIQGTVALNLVVDKQGLPVNVHVVRALGMGLDENAVAAVKQYRFQPATKDGIPIDKSVNIVVAYKFF